ncbi:hypothetical protein G6F31_021567 [Rhizopus arrhizus]|nr:hypothetical protein G6F31_021567 [Rhizopus arrhizus]
MGHRRAWRGWSAATLAAGNGNPAKAGVCVDDPSAADGWQSAIAGGISGEEPDGKIVERTLRRAGPGAAARRSGRDRLFSDVLRSAARAARPPQYRPRTVTAPAC